VTLAALVGIYTLLMGIVALWMVGRWMAPWDTVVVEQHRGLTIELRVGARSAQLLIDGATVAQTRSRRALGAIRLAHTSADGWTVTAGQRLGPSGEASVYIDTPPRLGATDPLALPGSTVPELGTVEALLDALQRALEEPSLVDAVDAVRLTARRHAEVLERAAVGALGGPEGDALVDAHRAHLVRIGAELRRLHDRLDRSADAGADMREALLRLAAAVEVRTARDLTA